MWWWKSLDDIERSNVEFISRLIEDGEAIISNERLAWRDTGDEGRSEGTGWGWTTYPCVASRASPPSLSDGKAVVYLPARVERAPEATNRTEFSSTREAMHSHAGLALTRAAFRLPNRALRRSCE